MIMQRSAARMAKTAVSAIKVVLSWYCLSVVAVIHCSWLEVITWKSQWFLIHTIEEGRNKESTFWRLWSRKYCKFIERGWLIFIGSENIASSVNDYCRTEKTVIAKILSREPYKFDTTHRKGSIESLKKIAHRWNFWYCHDPERPISFKKNVTFFKLLLLSYLFRQHVLDLILTGIIEERKGKF